MDHSRFGKLSAELRNQIYELVLVHNDSITITTDDYNSDLRSNLPPQSHPLALLRTCKRASEESTALFYGNNTFHFQFTEQQENAAKDEFCLVQRFYASIGVNALVGLRNIQVTAVRSFGLKRRPNMHAVSVFPRAMLGLQGISVLNDELDIQCTIEAHADYDEWVIVTLRIAALEATLDAAIALLANSGKDLTAYDLRQYPVVLVHKELRFFKETFFGSGEAPSKSLQGLRLAEELTFGCTVGDVAAQHLDR